MPDSSCPVCTLNDILTTSSGYECATCGHEWSTKQSDATTLERIVKDANGAVLKDGDDVRLIKDLKVKGVPKPLKAGSRAKNIRLVDGDHEIDCKIDSVALMLKAIFVKKA